MTTATITVEVAYALAHSQKIIAFTVPQGTTLLEAVQQSGIDKVYPEIDISTAKFGIFGKAVKNTAQELTSGQRVEIYRPLIADPKASRANRAAKAKAKKDA